MMSIHRRARKGSGSGRVEYSYSPMVWVRDANGRRQVWGGTFRTKAEAKAQERKLLQGRDAGSDLRPNTMTLAQVVEQYLREKQNKVKLSTLQRSTELLAHLTPILGSTPVARLRPADVSNAYNLLQGRLSKRTVRHCHWQLHGALDLAVRWGQVPVNVATRVEPPEPESFEGRALSRSDTATLLESLRGKPLFALVVLALDSGAREGELLALRWSDINFETGVVHIGRSVRKVKGAFTFADPKTRHGRRTVGVSAPTLAVLKSHRQRQLEQRLRAGELWQDLDLIFATDLGAPQAGSNVSHQFANAARAAGFEGLRFHDLRHTSVSMLLASGASMADVSRRAGHAGIGVTVDTYGHRLGVASSLAETMGAILGAAVAEPDGWLANG